MEEKDFIELYRKAVEQDAEESNDLQLKDNEIEEVWGNVSDELDIDEVWRNITDILDKGKRRKTVGIIISWSAAAVILALFGLFLIVNESQVEELSNKISSTKEAIRPSNTRKSITQEKSNTSNNIKEKTIEPQVGAISNQLASTPIKNIFSKDQPIADTLSNLLAKKKAIKDIRIEKINNNLQDSSIEMIKFLSSEEIIFSSINIATLSYSALANNYPIVNDTKHFFNNRFSIGFTNVLKNTWLINRETLEGLNPKDLKTTSAKFFPDFGVNVKYSGSKKWSAEGSVFISSNIGQSYNEYIYGEYSQKEIVLRYTTIDFSVKCTYYKPKSFPYINLNSTMGIYFSKLQSARLAINNQKQNISNQYLNIDYGLVIGQEVEINLFDRISLAPGLYFRIGIPNIIRSQSAITSSVSNSRNGSLDFKLSIYYKLYK